MKDMEQGKFEAGWKEAFNDADVTPSDNLWTNIELDLERAAGKKMKRRVLFYKLMAAASIAFAMCVAGVSAYYAISNTSDNQLVYANNNSKQQITIQPKEKVIEDLPLLNTNKENSNVISDKISPAKEVSSNDRLLNETTSEKNHLDRNDNGIYTNSIARTTDTPTNKGKRTSLNVNNDVASETIYNEASLPTLMEGDKETRSSNIKGSTNTDDRNGSTFLVERKLPASMQPRQPKLTFPQPPELDPVVLMMARLEERERELMHTENKKAKTSKSKKQNETLWTTVGIAAGTMKSDNIYYYNNSKTESPTHRVDPDKALGSTYSLGLSLGTSVADKWVVQGGVNYMNQNSLFESNTVVKDNVNSAARIAEVNDLTNLDATNNIKATPTYNINSNLQFISVPVQAGYIAINGAFGVQINAGVSTDLFLQSTAEARNSSLKTVKQGNGADSPYRTINFSGLFGTELSYRFGEHYRLALSPGMRYPLNSMYKDQINVQSTPLMVDVGMKFRYIFH